MNALRVLFIASELAPLTGDAPRARENRFLARALAEIGADITIALPGSAVPEAARSGLARRLSPYELPAADGRSREFVVLEGSVGDHRVSVLVLDGLDDQGETFLSAIHGVIAERDAEPDVLVLSHGTDAVLAALASHGAGAETSARPATVFLARDLTDPALDTALAVADRVILPSRAYAQALLEQMDANRMGPASRSLASARDRLYGVPAGTDTIEWNPHQDGSLDRDFPRDPLRGKAAHKQRLRDELGLRPHSDQIPLVAVVGPIDESILTYGMVNSLIQLPIQMVIIAAADTDAKTIRHLQRASNQHPQRVALCTFTDQGERQAFEHHLLAAADFSLVPRDFSPAHMCDLHALHYGTLPIAPRTGWFADYLVEIDRLSATGCGFLYEPYNSDHLLDALNRALRVFAHKDSMAALVEQVMTLDLSWRTAAQRYINIIVDMMLERRARVRDAV